MRMKDMKVKVWYRLMAMAFLGLTLTACVDIFDNPVPGQRVDNGDDASDSTPYQVTEVSVNDNGESTKTVTLRYYEDMPHVAYISVVDFRICSCPTSASR